MKKLMLEVPSGDEAKHHSKITKYSFVTYDAVHENFGLC